MERFRGGLVSKAHRLLYHSTLGSRVIKKKSCARRPAPLATWPALRLEVEGVRLRVQGVGFVVQGLGFCV